MGSNKSGVAAVQTVVKSAMWTVLALALCAGPQAATAGELTGSVKYLGTRKPGAALEVPRDTQACGTSVPDESLRLDAIVYIENPPATEKRRTEEVSLNQSGCRFVPHVLAMQRGQKLITMNSDPILHNAHALAGKKTSFNLAYPIRGLKVPLEISDSGLLRIRCDAGHTWMSAWLYVFEHPFFAKTDASGAFTIKGLPDGTYELVVWHETLGTRKQTITTGGGAKAVLVEITDTPR